MKEMPEPLGRAVDRLDWSAFYAEHASPVLIFLARRCLDPEVAVDLMAETFAHAFAKRSEYRGKTRQEASAWVFSIARHQLADYFRRGRARQRAVRRLGLTIPVLAEDEYARIEELADLRLIRTTLAKHFEQLSTDQKDAVRLRVIQEIPYSEVARRLGISEATARARVSRGLRRLGTALDNAVLVEGG
jgi:RNA polymerase sigma-70 factor (ECF subfamily)